MTVVTNPACTENDKESESIQPSTSLAQPSTSNGEYPDYGGLRLDENSRLYDDEKQSDVVFVAGINGDTYRFPGHRRVLAATSPVFAAVLSGKSSVVVIDYIDRRGFDQLLRYYYCEHTQLNSVFTARATLDAAYKFLCPQLAERCAKRLDEMLDAEVALEILRDLRYLCARLPGAASAPPLPALENDAAARTLSHCARWCDSLAHNALLVLDENADAALTHEKLEDLTYEDLALIVKRDTLRVSSELVLVEALARWSTAACKRTKKELTPSNKRAALGELAYCPRYLLLRGEDLDRALGMELLEPIERSLVLARARKLAAPVPVGHEQESMLRKWAQPRPTEPAAAPVRLSARSEPPEEPKPSKLCVRRPKKLKQPSFEPEDTSKKKQGCCSKCCHGLIHAFVCLFD
ncbi:BTB/POZ domain-containing protein 6 [Aricia agestis]|uniref:BTB/POZ domain-containing protein 6 n=1 Tax=Aricia agestis TaxID=91739 RepID=UPI001C2095A0|nr:BTB/POZ domain-containing protein 6 [Aricia agestis]XP_041987556.1 BTB/POZ domain-containing protein 6 [Aricia agestis]